MFLFSETIKIESDNSHVPRRLETIAHAIPQFIIVKCGMCICVAPSVDGEGFGVDACQLHVRLHRPHRSSTPISFRRNNAEPCAYIIAVCATETSFVFTALRAQHQDPLSLTTTHGQAKKLKKLHLFFKKRYIFTS